jgi:hypothetical protein
MDVLRVVLETTPPGPARRDLRLRTWLVLRKRCDGETSTDSPLERNAPIPLLGNTVTPA